MNVRRKISSVITIVLLLSAFTFLHLHAQTPTATPETETVTSTPVSVLPTAIPTPLPPRQAVVKSSLDGDSVEVVFTDNGQIATIHLANVDAPESVKEAECFGRESSEYAVQAYQGNPLISIELAGEIEDGEGTGYVHLADGTFLNLVTVLFGYARYDDTIQSVYSEKIKDAEVQSKQGKTGLWRACGQTDAPPKPCFLFSGSGGIDSASKREALAHFESVSDIAGQFRYAYYDPVQNEVILTWQLSLDRRMSNSYLDEYFRLPDCSFDRSVIYEK